MVAAPTTTLRYQTSTANFPFSAGHAFGFGSANINGILQYQKIGEYQDVTFSATTKGGIGISQQINNIKYLTSSTAAVGALSTSTAPTLNLTNIPNYCAPLNLRVTSGPSIRINKCNLYFHTGQASGVSPAQFDIKYFECFHVSTSTGVAGSGLTSWGTIAASSNSSIPLRGNPGLSGVNPSGSTTPGTQHDWYICFSATPVRTYSAASFNISCMIEYV